MPIPADYEQRVYAGILGKLIGVYLGRPFEGWSNERIERELGEIDGYVHERLNRPLIVADDDISGTFTFLRALEDHGVSPDLTAEQIGRTWLNYLIEERTILWWGGMGTSTEHTAYLRLKHGVPAPESGSISRNSKVVAEQIGAQIFIDGWSMVAPGDPDLAVGLATEAARVSHDGEAVYGAQVIAAMESAAFAESDRNKLLDLAVTRIPDTSIIARLIADLRNWHAKDGDWRTTLRRVQDRYGYDTYGGGCHMVPNHAVILLALLYGDDDFSRSLLIANTAGWDTDCNSGNVGCLMGIKNGLDAIDARWRVPVADRMFKISADGGDGVTDAVRETYRLCALGRQLVGQAPLPAPKDGARFHFSLPGSVQGFCAENASVTHVDGDLHLDLTATSPDRPARLTTRVYATPGERTRGGYRMELSPSLYPGHAVRATVRLPPQTPASVSARLLIRAYPEQRDNMDLAVHTGPATVLTPGQASELVWTVPDLGGLPVVDVGVECAPVSGGTLVLESLTWDGVPSCSFIGAGTSAHDPSLNWTNAVSSLRRAGSDRIAVIQNEGRGLLLAGEQRWKDYCVSATVTPHLAKEVGIAARAGGLRRFCALLLCDNAMARLLRCDHTDTVLAEAAFDWTPGTDYALSLAVAGSTLLASVDDVRLFSVTDDTLPSGGIALVQSEGRSFFSNARVAPC